MDKFDRFIANLDELIAGIPHKQVGAHVIGYTMAIHAVRNAAYTAKCASASETLAKPSNGSSHQFKGDA